MVSAKGDRPVRYVILVWKMGFQSGEGTGFGFSIEEGVLGPFRSEEAAERKATSIRRAIERAEWDEDDDRPDGVSVLPLNPGSTAARDAVIAHLVHDVGIRE